MVYNPITCLNKDNGLKNFEDKTVPTNRADLLWHGIGHVVYAGKQRAKVIIYNNYARTIYNYLNVNTMGSTIISNEFFSTKKEASNEKESF